MVDPSTGALLGMSYVDPDTGVEHDFSGATVAAELAKRLRPDLAALMKEA